MSLYFYIATFVRIHRLLNAKNRALDLARLPENNLFETNRVFFVMEQ